MLKIQTTSKFEKDLKKSKKRNKDLNKLKKIISKLSIPEPLDTKNKDHKLAGS